MAELDTSVMSNPQPGDLASTPFDGLQNTLQSLAGDFFSAPDFQQSYQAPTGSSRVPGSPNTYQLTDAAGDLIQWFVNPAGESTNLRNLSKEQGIGQWAPNTALQTVVSTGDPSNRSGGPTGPTGGAPGALAGGAGGSTGNASLDELLHLITGGDSQHELFPGTNITNITNAPTTNNTNLTSQTDNSSRLTVTDTGFMNTFGAQLTALFNGIKPLQVAPNSQPSNDAQYSSGANYPGFFSTGQTPDRPNSTPDASAGPASAVVTGFPGLSLPSNALQNKLLLAGVLVAVATLLFLIFRRGRSA